MIRQIVDDYPTNLLDALVNHGHQGEEKWDYILPSDILPTIDYVLGMLTERESMVIQLRFKYGLTLTDVAKEYGNVTRERIRQVEAKAIRKLNHPTRRRWLIHGVTGMIESAEVAAASQAVTNELKSTINEISKISFNLAELVGKKPIETSMDKFNQEQILDLEIDELDLSVRSYNCLNRAGIKTLGDITNLSSLELLRVRNLGKRSYDEIVKVLEDKGLCLKA